MKQLILVLVSIMMVLANGFKFICTEEGYREYLSRYPIKCGDDCEEYIKIHYDDYHASCEMASRKSRSLVFRLDETIYLDFSESYLEEMMDTTTKYTGVGSYCDPVDPNEPVYSYDLDPRIPNSEDHPTLIQYASNHNCSISWATATIAAAEQALRNEGITDPLSLEYLLSCYEEEMEEDICSGVLMTDLQYFIANNGLISESEALRLKDSNMCTDPSAVKYKFTTHRPTSANRGGLMNLIAESNPTIALMSLNLNRLRFTASMTEEDRPYEGAYHDPSIYGVVTGYNETAAESWWMVDMAVTPFEHQLIKLPMRDNETNANYAGIAAYAFSIQYAGDDLIVSESAYPTLESIPYNVRSLTFTPFSYASITEVSLARFINLKEVTFEKNSFPHARSLVASNMGLLKRMDVQEGAFAEGLVFEVSHTTIDHLSIGSNCFNGQEEETSGNLRRLSSGLESLFALIDNANLQEVIIPHNSFTHTKNIKLEQLDNISSIVIEGALLGEKAPFESSTSFVMDAFINLRSVILGNRVCKEASVFSVDSPHIENVVIGEECFQGRNPNPVGDTASLTFSMVNKANLQTTSLGRNSFSFFNTYELNNNPMQTTALVGVSGLTPRSRRLEESSDEPMLGSFTGVSSLTYANLSSLATVEFGENSFTNANGLVMYYLDSLKTVTLGKNAFAQAATFSVADTSMEELTIASGCFNGEDHIPARRRSLPTLRSGPVSAFSLYDNRNLKSINIPENSFKNTKNMYMSGLDSMTSITISGIGSADKAPFQDAGSFIANNLQSLSSVDLGRKSFQGASVFSVESPAIQSVKVSQNCFQGREDDIVSGSSPLQFSMINKSELKTTVLGAGSFSFFNRYEIRGNPKQEVATVGLVEHSENEGSGEGDSIEEVVLPTFSLVRDVIIENMENLVEVTMGSNSFPNVTQVTLVELPAIRNITMEEGSFGRVDNLVISNLGNTTERVLNVQSSSLNTESITVTMGGSEHDQAVIEHLRESVPTIEEIVIATIPPTPSPTDSPTYPPFDCAEGLVPLYIRRVYGRHASEETFSLYLGSEVTDSPLYTGSYDSSDVVLKRVCTLPVCHVLTLEDSYGDGWADQSTVSFILQNNTMDYTFTLEGGRTKTIHLFDHFDCPDNIPTIPPTIPPTLPPTLPPTPEPYVTVTLYRDYGRYAAEESYSIYEGYGTSGPLVFSDYGTSSDWHTYNYKTHQFKYTVYTIYMYDSFGDGWDDSHGSSYLSFYINGQHIKTVYISGRSGIAYIDFSPYKPRQ